MRLMISVVSAEEAREAMAGGADILDIKNPAEGSLGAQSPSVIREIRKLASGRVKVSAAIGDMPNLPGTAALAALGAATCGVDYIKVGLMGPRNEDEAITLLREVVRAVEEFRTPVIAAAYADFKRSGTLNPNRLPGIASRAGVQGCLLDTAMKDDQGLLDFLDKPGLSLLSEQAHANGLLFGVAGSLREQDLISLRDLGADIVGIRTAACRDSRRNGSVETARVLHLRRILVPVV